MRSPTIPWPFRPGIVYTANGRASFGLPPGKYRIFAGRGFEYSLANQQVQVKDGETAKILLTIDRAVPTEGYVACDTHVHTLTHSGHGDATVHERMVTIAAEGIELPIATDHNVQIDHAPFARAMNVADYFTPVIGNEVTTPVGHFNVFPIKPDARIPNHRSRDWKEIFASIYETPGVKIAILNHGRDLHGGTRPLGPQLFLDPVGANLEGWHLQANAMEIVNSGATQTDVLRLARDWMSMLNYGQRITPVGCSDSHDVGRHFVGQGRTYVRVADTDPGRIDVAQAVNNFTQGQVMVSYGLLAEILVNDKFSSGEFARTGKLTQVAVKVLAPEWIDATQVMLFANGQLIREAQVDPNTSNDLPSGTQWRGEWTIPTPAHDVHLVAIALGRGVDGLYWRTAKPYQPTSPEWTARTFACSGAVFLDADADGRWQSARDYGQRLAQRGTPLNRILEMAQSYDQAIMMQAVHRYQVHGGNLLSAEDQATIAQTPPPTRNAVKRYLDGWRTSQQARGRPGR